jgi:hypothetical protein
VDILHAMYREHVTALARILILCKVQVSQWLQVGVDDSRQGSTARDIHLRCSRLRPKGRVRLAARVEGGGERRWGWLDLYGIYCMDLYVHPVTQKRDRPFRPFDAKTGNSTMEVDVERCPFRPQRQNQKLHMLLELLAHFKLRKIGAREPRQGEIKFLAPKIYLLANTHTLTPKSILQITLHLNLHTRA